jgi:hypothetical protein
LCNQTPLSSFCDPLSLWGGGGGDTSKRRIDTTNLDTVISIVESGVTQDLGIYWHHFILVGWRLLR